MASTANLNTKRRNQIGEDEDGITTMAETGAPAQETEPLLRSANISGSEAQSVPASATVSDAAVLDANVRKNKASAMTPIIILALVRVAEPTAITQVNTARTCNRCN